MSVQSLKQSVTELQIWLDQCQDSLDDTNTSTSDPLVLTQLALKYKDLLTQLKVRYKVIQDLKSSLQKLKTEPARVNNHTTLTSYPLNGTSKLECLTIGQEVDVLHSKWSSTCIQVKEQYSKLSIALKNVKGRGLTPLSQDNSRHTSPEKPEESVTLKKVMTQNGGGTHVQNGGTHPYDLLEVNGNASLDSLLESLQLEAEKQVKSLDNELNLLSNTHPKPSLPKPSVLSNQHKTSAKNGHTHLSSTDQTVQHVRQISNPVNSTKPLVPPSKPPRTKSPLRINYSFPQSLRTSPEPLVSTTPVINKITPPPILDKPPTQVTRKTTPPPVLSKPPCRLAKKLDDVSRLIDKSQLILMTDSPCELQSAIIEKKICEMREILTLLDLNFEELQHLIKEAESIPTSPSLTCPLKTAYTTYTLLELACCKDSLVKSYRTVEDLQSMANEQICHLELVLELIQQFESEAEKCHEYLSKYETKVSELRNRMLEGRMSDQPWTSAKQSLDSGEHCQEKLKALRKLSKQLLSLEPHFNGQPIRENVGSLKDSFQALQMDAGVVIQSSVTHRVKFALESIDIIDDWMNRVEKQLQDIEQGMSHDASPQLKEELCQEVIEHQQTLLLTTEQFQHIVNISTDARAKIQSQEQITAIYKDIEERQKRLLCLCESIENLDVSILTRAPLEETDEMITSNEVHSLQKYTVTEPSKKKGPVYTEIQATTDPSSPPHVHIRVPPLIYSEVVIPKLEKSETSNETLNTSESNSSRGSSPVFRSVSPSDSSNKIVIQLLSPNRKGVSPAPSPSPPPPPQAIMTEKQPVFEPKSHDNDNKIEAIVKTNAPEPIQYDVPRPHSLRVTLLKHIDEEYTNIANSLEIDGGFKTPDLKESIALLPKVETRNPCADFLTKLENLREALESIHKDLENIAAPKEPLISLIEKERQKCAAVVERLFNSNDLLSKYNFDSSNIHSLLSCSSPSFSPSLQSTTNNSIILQLESELFDLGCYYHRCQSLLRAKARLIRDREREISSLHTDLEKLTLCLEEAKTLLAQREGILDVGQYLKDCKEMHLKLAHHSKQRKQAACRIRDLLFDSTQSHPSVTSISPTNKTQPSYSLQLLEQLRNIEMQWVNVVNDLMNMQQLEPILIKNMIRNMAKEVKSLEPLFAEMECKGINLEVITLKCDLCEAKLKSSKRMQSSLAEAKVRIERFQYPHEVAPIYDHPRSFMSTLPIVTNGSNVDKPMNGIGDTNDVKSIERSEQLHSKQLVKEDPVKHSVGIEEAQSIIPQRHTSIGMMEYENTIDYIKLTKSLLTLSGVMDRVVTGLEALYLPLHERKCILENFWTESKSLGTWIEDTKLAIKEKISISEDSESLGEQTSNEKEKLSKLQDLAKQLLAMPSDAADRSTLKSMTDQLVKGWQSLFKYLPLNIQVTLQPSDDPLTHLKPPDEFEDIQSMMEWLILLESKLQPHPLIVGDTKQVKRALNDVAAIERELSLKSPEYHRFMKYGRHGDHSDSDSSSPTQSRGGSPPKTVKFIDENTLERHYRKKQIKQDKVLDTILSEDELEGEEDSSSSSNGSESPPLIPITVQNGMNQAPESPQTQNSRQKPAPINIPSSSHIPPPAILSPKNTEESHQLSLLWNGVWATVTQRKQKLESVLDIWTGFESKRCSLELFIDKGEGEMEVLFGGLKHPSSAEEINKAIAVLEAAGDEVTQYQRTIGTLNDLTSDLILHHKQTDNTNELQQEMTKLNLRWKKVNESFTKHKSALEPVIVSWNNFYEQFHSFWNFLNQCDGELTNINPSVTDIAVIKTTLEKIKHIQKDLVSQSGQLGMIRQLNVKLQEAVVSKVTDFSVVNKDIKKLEKKWESVSKLIDERQTSLQQSFTARQEILSILSRCETWCRRAIDYLAGQKPLSADVSIINAKIDVHTEFQSELTDKQTQLSLALARAKHITGDFSIPNSLMQEMDGNEAKMNFIRVQSKLEEILLESVELKKAMESVLLVMDKFQLLSKQFSQNLTDILSRMPHNFQPSTTLPGLKQQQEMWQSMDTNTTSLGRILETMVSSQKRLKEMGVKVSPDAVQLVKRYHKQWNDLRKPIIAHLDTIKKTIWKLDPTNVEMTLPRGWMKAKTVQGTPYYIDTLSGNHTQWQHPELSDIYRSFASRFRHSFYPSPAYPISLRLRAIQKAIQFEYLPTQVALETFDLYNLTKNPKSSLTGPEMIEIALSMFQKAASLPVSDDGTDINGMVLGGASINVNRAVELSVSWIQDVYDLTHTGTVSTLAFQIAIICLSATKMDEKHKALFHIVSRCKNTIDKETMTRFLEVLLQIPQSMTDSQYCSLDLLEANIRECFKKYATGIHLHSVGYTAWAQAEPLPIAWLPILHRMAAAETMEHSVKCSVCRDPSIVGFRYKCLQCVNFNMCQECYWSGKTAKDHDRSKHFMEEYCISPDERGLFFRTLGNRGKKKSPHRTPPTELPTTGSPNMQVPTDLDELRKQLSNPTRKSSYPDYQSLSLRRDSSSNPSLPIISRSGRYSSGKGGSYSNLLDTSDVFSRSQPNPSHFRFSPTSPTYHNFDLHTPTSPRHFGYDALDLLPSQPVGQKIPMSRSFDLTKSLDESVPPPLPQKLIKNHSLPKSSTRRTPDRQSPQHSQNRALSPLEQNNVFLRGRVEQLESQNKHLEKYITQLKAHQQDPS